MSYIANINIKHLSPEVLEKAKQLREEIDKLEMQLAHLLSGQPVTLARRGRPPKNIKLLKAAKVNGVTPVKRKKRVLSPEARARIVAAVKARWAREKSNKTEN